MAENRMGSCSSPISPPSVYNLDDGFCDAMGTLDAHATSNETGYAEKSAAKQDEATGFRGRGNQV